METKFFSSDFTAFSILNNNFSVVEISFDQGMMHFQIWILRKT